MPGSLYQFDDLGDRRGIVHPDYVYTGGEHVLHGGVVEFQGGLYQLGLLLLQGPLLLYVVDYLVKLLLVDGGLAALADDLRKNAAMKEKSQDTGVRTFTSRSIAPALATVKLSEWVEA